MFKTIPWSTDLNLLEFYATAELKGFVNNSSQKMLVDSFKNEKEKQIWILYFNDIAVGSVAAHSFDDVMGEGSYRIAARTCVFTEKIPGTYGKGLRTVSVITKHQNPTAQFLIPTCIQWIPPNSRLFITSNESKVGTQRRVHSIFGPELERQGVMQRIKDVVYRDTPQTVWEFFPDKFYTELNKHHKWV